MAKRFITTELFNDTWFMDLPNKYKLFWIYLITACDYFGVWEVNFKVATFYVGEALEPIEVERFLKDRIVKIRDGKYWFFPKFIEFQYGSELKTSNSTVKNVIKFLQKNELVKYLSNTVVFEAPSKELQSSLIGGKDKDKDKDMDKEKLKEVFDEFRKLYPGSKRGLETEFDEFVKKTNDWKKVIPNLSKTIVDQITERKRKLSNDEFVPNWKNLKTWLNQRCWEEETSNHDERQDATSKILTESEEGWL